MSEHLPDFLRRCSGCGNILSTLRFTIGPRFGLGDRLCDWCAAPKAHLVLDKNAHIVARLDGKRPVFGSGT